MPRRVLLILLAFLLVIVGSLSGAWANQVWSESNAHGQMVSARKSAQTALRRAATIGLLAVETASLRRAAARLDAASAPSSSPFWRAEMTRFYQRQAAAYRRVHSGVRFQEKAITAKTRADAQQKLDGLKQSLAAAARLEIDPSAPRTVLAEQEARFASTGTFGGMPSQYRSISSTVKPISALLDERVKARQRYVSSVIVAGRNAAAGVAANADQEAADAQVQLALLGLLTPRASQYTVALRSLTTAVHTQRSVFDAAVKESHLHDEVGKVRADFARTIPAKMIVVSTGDQEARVYEVGREIFTTPVTTGGPELPTDHGVFHIYMKASPFTFHSPWPIGSPYYYPPTDINYWMPFYQAEGLHDASWRSNFGPGSNFAPTDLGTGQTILGTHGCVNLPAAAAEFIWNWAPVGTTVVVT